MGTNVADFSHVPVRATARAPAMLAAAGQAGRACAAGRGEEPRRRETAIIGDEGESKERERGRVSVLFHTSLTRDTMDSRSVRRCGSRSF